MPEYCEKIPVDCLSSFAELLNQPIKILSKYVRRWDDLVYAIDPLVRTYKIMPGEENTVDSVRILLNRGVRAQQVAVHELRRRGNAD